MSARPTPAGFEPFAWHHLRGAVPAGWEVSRYSVEDRDGRLEFANREGLRATASWEPCEREPDRATTMASFLERNLLGRAAARERGLRRDDLRTEEVGPFLAGWLDDELPLQALAYDRAGGRLVRWIFEGASDACGRREVVAPVLRACDFNDDPDVCEYRLFGVHAVLPRDYRVEDMVVLPANVLVTFEQEKGRSRATFRRWGLASSIRGDDSLLDFYAGVVRTNRIEVLSSEPRTINGHEGILARFSAPREHHGDRYMARRWRNGIAYVWHDRDANRIAAFEQIGPDGREELPPSTVPGLSVSPAVAG